MNIKKNMKQQGKSHKFCEQRQCICGITLAPKLEKIHKGMTHDLVT